MIKKIIEEKHFCDTCKKPAQYTCEGCGKDICNACFKGSAVLYLKSPDMTEDSVFVVCNKCDKKPPTKIAPYIKVFKELKAFGEKEIKRREEYGDMVDQYRKDHMPKFPKTKKNEDSKDSV